MPISKKKQAKRAASKKFFAEQRETLLAKVGYTALKAKHGKTKPLEIPSYKVESKHALSHTVSPNGLKVRSGAEHPDAQKFNIIDNHKQGPMLLTKADDMKFAGGKKT